MNQINALPATTEVLDDLEFVCVPFAAYNALGLFARVMSTIGPALSGMDPSTEVTSLGPSAFKHLNAAEAQSLILEILKNTHVWLDDGSGKPKKIEINTQGKFDQVFNGRLKTIFKAVALALKVNFASFTDGSESDAAAPQPPASSL